MFLQLSSISGSDFSYSVFSYLGGSAGLVRAKPRNGGAEAPPTSPRTRPQCVGRGERFAKASDGQLHHPNLLNHATAMGYPDCISTRFNAQIFAAIDCRFPPHNNPVKTLCGTIFDSFEALNIFDSSLDEMHPFT